jgi:hypothetical protein
MAQAARGWGVFPAKSPSDGELNAKHPNRSQITLLPKIPKKYEIEKAKAP